MSCTPRRNAGKGRSVNRTSKWCTPEKRAAIYLRDRFACVYCGREPMARRHHQRNAIFPGLELDHLIPRSRGGDNKATNIVTACEVCNNRKSDRTVEEWLAQGSMYERTRLVGIRERIAIAIATPIDLLAGKQHVGVRASRPLPEYARPAREHAETPF